MIAAMKSTVATGSDEFKRNRAHYLARIDDLRKRRAEASQGGSVKARALHRSRGQLLPRERIAALIDPGSPFLEFGHLAGEGMYDGVPPGARSSRVSDRSAAAVACSLPTTPR